jgi:uncharacterized protein (DUF433 family)
MVSYQEFIAINLEIRFGKPCIKGTRISVYDVLGYLASGMTIPEITDDFPELSEKNILACLSYASDKERR